MLQKCESSPNIRYTSNILTQINYLKVVLASEEMLIYFYDLWGNSQGKM